VIVDNAMVEQYLVVFRGIFEKTDHGAHYRMMIGPEALETGLKIAGDVVEGVIVPEVHPPLLIS
jgi:hypothetical protein